MAKIRREEVIDEALKLLNEVGLDGLTTRLLARRLGVESATLYWHFHNKAELLSDMSSRILAQHHDHGVPNSIDHWQHWMAENARSFRHALVAYRDGARLHAGTTPTPAELERISAKIEYLAQLGLPKREAAMALYSMGQFTLGCVLEEQARSGRDLSTPNTGVTSSLLSVPAQKLAELGKTVNDKIAFEFGLTLFLDGLKGRLDGQGPKPVRLVMDK